MNYSGNIFFDSAIPHGALLLSLRGAINNLKDALESGKGNLIINRRRELFEMLSIAKGINMETDKCQSILSKQLISNLISEIERGDVILIRASALLSTSLVLV